MRRREFIAGLGTLATLPLAVRAQQSQRMPVMGVLWQAASREEEVPFFDWLREGFTRLGYVPGKNIKFEDRYPAEVPERFESMAAELVQMKVDVMIGVGGLASHSAIVKATKTIPIVLIGSDPVGSGFVKSLAHPGDGNVTAVSLMIFDLAAKGLQIFKEALPSLSRLALIANQFNPIQKYFMERNLRDYTAAGRELGIEIKLFEVASKDEVAPAFSNIAQSGCDGVLIGRSNLFNNATMRAAFAEQALAVGLPTFADLALYPESGCLMSYSSLWREAYWLVATCVQRILAGEKPGDIPVQQPTKFELVINLKTARALGISINPAVLARADRFIE